MPRTAKALSALEVGRLSDAGYHFVGGVPGLLLQVKPPGVRTWLLRVMVGGRRREIGLGGFPEVSLAGAREAARTARAKIRDGIDPVEESKAKRSALVAARAASITFGDAAASYIAAHASGWKNAKHTSQWAATLETYAFPTIGKIGVAEVETAHVIHILESIWTTKTETASRLRGRIESVLDWATVRGFRKGENPARWRGHLDKLLPARARVQKVEHHAALDYREIGAFMVELAKIEGMGARALEFAILTASRSGEVRGATWTEIDKSAGVWTIPADRMKAGKEHRVPLSETVLKLLEGLPRMAGCDLAFPNAKETQLSDMTLTAVLKRMKCPVTAHGFRSTFRDWAGETTAYPREVIEHALAHQLKDKAEAAYARGTLFDKRAQLMDEWAKHCATVTSITDVTPVNARAPLDS